MYKRQDLKTKVIDAKIFTASEVHPDGWGTILICGLNMGGKQITVADAEFSGGTKTFNPTYTAIDITVPDAPVFLWEQTYSGMGFASTMPTVLKVKDAWFLAIGSGPTTYDGTSDQRGKVFIVNLSNGLLRRTFETTESNAFMNAPVALDKGMQYNVAGVYVGSTYLSGGAWLGRAYKIAIPQNDADGHYSEECNACYDDNPANWIWSEFFQSPAPFTAPFSLTMDQKNNVWVLMGTGRYIATADKANGDQQYIFGLKDPFFNRRGAPIGGTYTPDCFNNYAGIGCTLTMSDLFNASPYKITDQGAVAIKSGYTDTLNLAGKSFQEFLQQGVKKKSEGSNPIEVYQGWYRTLAVAPASCPCVCTDISCTSSTPCLLDLYCPSPCSRETCTSSERMVNKPAAFGGIALFPTFSPISDPCKSGGSSKLYGVYYESGTPNKATVFKAADNTDTIQDVISLGAGLASSPAIHAAKQEGESGTVISQLSTGQIVEVQVVPAIVVKSGAQYWREGRPPGM